MKTITEVINDTLRELHAMKESNNDSSFCFPRYADGKLRISEQELRICLIKNLYQAHYKRISVETPTKYAYSFKGGVKCKKKEDIQQNNEDCKYLSARLDLTLLNEDNASFDTIFELKAHASTKQEALYQDFVKLTQEDAGQKFFVMIFEGLSESLKRNFKKRFNDCFEEGVRYLDGRKEDILQMCYFYDIKDASTAPETYTKDLKAYLRK